MFAGGWYTEAKRWATYPATLLFIVSLLWLVRNLIWTDWAHLQPVTEQAYGILALVWNLLVVPIGGVVVGIYLLYLKRWAFFCAPLLPLAPLLSHTTENVVDIGRKFGEFHDAAAVRSLGGGLMDSFVLLALWAAYALMLWHLYRGWRLIGGRPPWLRRGTAAALSAGGYAVPEPAAENAEVCLLMPEIDDAEGA